MSTHLAIRSSADLVNPLIYQPVEVGQLGPRPFEQISDQTSDDLSHRVVDCRFLERYPHSPGHDDIPVIIGDQPVPVASEHRVARLVDERRPPDQWYSISTVSLRPELAEERAGLRIAASSYLRG